MTRDDIRAVVVRELGRVAPDADPAALGPDDDVRDGLDLDSMDFLRFVQELHAVLGVDVPERDYRVIATIGSCADYLARRLGEA